MSKKIKPIAIHLPQFHPVPENDDWWGKGFTEWTNVVKTTPKFKGHYQPHLPADLGFYDLRLEEARLAQEALAKAYGIYGFCYYHYWFNGKRMLYEPLDRKLKNVREDLPFMMCWANEDWTRIWEGSENKVLLKQQYSEEDDLKHIEHLLKYFGDDRYIKVQKKPIFVIYRPELFPDITKTLKLWRKVAKENGYPGLYLGYSKKSDIDYLPYGFDFAFEFQPSFSILPKPQKVGFLKRFAQKFGVSSPVKSKVYTYEAYSNLQKKQPFLENIYPGITPMWDNSARKENAFILNNATPKIYGKWLNYIKTNYPWNTVPENFIFINAWNEWAEGNHLEPCKKWGLEYLETTQNVLEA